MDISFGYDIVNEYYQFIGATGNVSLYINNVFNQTIFMDNGYPNLYLYNLSLGNYNLTFEYEGDDLFYNASLNKSFEVINFKNLTVDVKDNYSGVYNNITIDGKVTGLVDGDEAKVYLELYDSVNAVYYEYVMNTTNGAFAFNIIGLPVGNYSGYVYPWNEKYNGNDSDDFNVTVFKAVPSMDVDVEDVSVGDNVTVFVDLPVNATGNVTIIFNGTSTNVTIDDGMAIFNITGLPEGSYNVTVVYGGNDNYLNNSATVSFNVYDYKLITDDLIKFYKNGTDYIAIVTYANGTGIYNVTVSFTINNRTYTRTTNANGSASFAINLYPGVYDIETTYGDFTNFNTVTVKSIIDAPDEFEKYYLCNDTQYNATIFDGQGNPLNGTVVTININGMKYNRTTNKNGTFIMNINLAPGTYVLSFITANGEGFSSNVTVKSTIIGEDLDMFYHDNSSYVVKIVDCDGIAVENVTVTFNVNGRFYTRVTNVNGSASLKINLHPGEYIITATNSANGQHFSNNINVKTTLIGYDLNKTKGTSDQFLVDVLDTEGNPASNKTVELNVNGRIYNKDTDVNGTARLDINLDPGSYIMTSTYDGYSTSNKIIVTEA
ncbi:Ig-like domain repeat protein [Methanobrevibacter sp. OttesenSCG-928-K11]|nr:Ig-like domain repeat protein [Methanobrevibacter sp. OttesenSCG-928-K11]